MPRIPPKPPKGVRWGGRQKGVTNKATATAREAIAQFVEGNADRLAGWLDRIAEESPKDAFNAFMGVVEYHIPKLNRSEMKVEGKIDITNEEAVKTLDRLIRNVGRIREEGFRAQRGFS